MAGGWRIPGIKTAMTGTGTAVATAVHGPAGVSRDLHYVCSSCLPDIQCAPCNTTALLTTCV